MRLKELRGKPMKGIFGCKTDEVMAEWIKLPNEKNQRFAKHSSGVRKLATSQL
jgi:hypothetical protein